MRKRSKMLVGIAALALVGGIVIKTQQASLSTKIFERAVSQRVDFDLDSIGRLRDGLDIALCGTGS